MAAPTVMQLPKGSAELCATLETRIKPPGGVGFYPFPPVADKHVAWVERNLPAIRAMAQMPVVDDTQRDRVAGHLFKLFMQYTGSMDRTMTPAVLQQETARRKIIAEVFVGDISVYPEWAVVAGIAAFRRTPESKWAPKSPGELIEFISREYTKACRAIVACEKVLEAHRKGHNVDALRARLKGKEGKDLAMDCLEVMKVLEKSCNVYTDPVANDLHRYCHGVFHAWRKKNPLPKKGDADGIAK